MIHLVYISSITKWPSQADLVELLEQSRARNERQHITGMLVYHKGTFIQVLEGDEKDVHEIFAAICDDPRNNAVVKLIEEEIAARDFPDWSMAFKQLEEGDLGGLAAYVDLASGQLDRQALARNDSLVVRFVLDFANQL